MIVSKVSGNGTVKKTVKSFSFGVKIELPVHVKLRSIFFSNQAAFSKVNFSICGMYFFP